MKTILSTAAAFALIGAAAAQELAIVATEQLALRTCPDVRCPELVWI